MKLQIKNFHKLPNSISASVAVKGVSENPFLFALIKKKNIFSD